ncbi:MAG: hypothetical protein L7F78_10035 [Syntrophales bacterium LBB04]|nr:hypothetical protein [Syntrophales bacterium LBB04]
MAPELVHYFAGQIFAAMDYLHKSLIVWGDIKPGNIMIMPDFTLRMIDFAFADSYTAEKEAVDLTAIGSVLWLLAVSIAIPARHPYNMRPLQTGESLYQFALEPAELLQLIKTSSVSELFADFETHLAEGWDAESAILHPWMKMKTSRAQAFDSLPAGSKSYLIRKGVQVGDMVAESKRL